MSWVQDTQPNPTTHGLKEKFRIWLEPSHEAIGSAGLTQPLKKNQPSASLNQTRTKLTQHVFLMDIFNNSQSQKTKVRLKIVSFMELCSTRKADHFGKNTF